MEEARGPVVLRGSILHGSVLAVGLGAAVALGLLLAPAAMAAPPPGGSCPPGWKTTTVVVNPDDPGFFARIDRNRDGVVCAKDWTGPDPDPDIGFLVIDNVVRPA